MEKQEPSSVPVDVGRRAVHDVLAAHKGVVKAADVEKVCLEQLEAVRGARQRLTWKGGQ